MSIPGFEAYHAGGPDCPQPVGQEEGETCGRYEEPDEDAPRGYKPKPCNGVMAYGPVEGCYCHLSPPCSACVDNPLICDTCGASTDD